MYKAGLQQKGAHSAAAHDDTAAEMGHGSRSRRRDDALDAGLPVPAGSESSLVGAGEYEYWTRLVMDAILLKQRELNVRV